MKYSKSVTKVVFNALLLFAFLPSKAFASTTSDLPFVAVLSKIADALSGPVALAVALIGLAVGCMILILGDPGKGARMVISVLIGFSIVAAGFSFLGLFAPVGATM